MWFFSKCEVSIYFIFIDEDTYVYTKCTRSREASTVFYCDKALIVHCGNWVYFYDEDWNKYPLDSEQQGEESLYAVLKPCQ